MDNILERKLDLITEILENDNNAIKALTDIVEKDRKIIRELIVRIENLEKEIETLK